jgi:hypothetical protein
MRSIEELNTTSSAPPYTAGRPAGLTTLNRSPYTAGRPAGLTTLSQPPCTPGRPVGHTTQSQSLCTPARPPRPTTLGRVALRVGHSGSTPLSQQPIRRLQHPPARPRHNVVPGASRARNQDPRHSVVPGTSRARYQRPRPSRPGPRQPVTGPSRSLPGGPNR